MHHQHIPTISSTPRSRGNRAVVTSRPQRRLYCPPSRALFLDDCRDNLLVFRWPKCEAIHCWEISFSRFRAAGRSAHSIRPSEGRRCPSRSPFPKENISVDGDFRPEHNRPSPDRLDLIMMPFDRAQIGYQPPSTLGLVDHARYRSERSGAGLPCTELVSPHREQR